MDLAGIYHKANILIAQTYGITGVPEKGYVIVTVNNVRYIVYFYKGTFIKYYKISQLIHTQSIAN